MSNLEKKEESFKSDTKISPYLNNYGQTIVGENIDPIALELFYKKIKIFLDSNELNYENQFKNILKNNEIHKNFNYIELYRAIKLENIEQSIKYLEFRNRFKLASNRIVELPYPPYLLIEPVSACNLRCPMCFQIDKTFTRKPFMGVMKWDLFQKIVDEASKIGTGAITLASRGEPTMHPQIGKMLDYLSKKKNIFEVKLNTNASFLSEKICHEIYKADLNTIVISADHYEKEKFEILRKNSNFEKIVKNVKLLFDIRKKYYRNSLTEIRISGVDYYKNLDREKFKKFWKKISDNVSVSEAVERWDTYNNSPQNDNLSSCTFLWDRMYVWHDGKCNPCDQDYKSYLSYGNANKNTLSDIWNSKELKSIRTKHLEKKRNKIIPCDRCGIEFN